jgi:hypothetical protein
LFLEHDGDGSLLCEALVTEYCSDLEIETTGEVQCESEPVENVECTFETRCRQEAILGEQAVVVHSNTFTVCSVGETVEDDEWRCWCAPPPNEVVLDGKPFATCADTANACVDAMEAQPNLSTLPDEREPLAPR